MSEEEQVEAQDAPWYIILNGPTTPGPALERARYDLIVKFGACVEVAQRNSASRTPLLIPESHAPRDLEDMGIPLSGSDSAPDVAFPSDVESRGDFSEATDHHPSPTQARRLHGLFPAPMLTPQSYQDSGPDPSTRHPNWQRLASETGAPQAACVHPHSREVVSFQAFHLRVGIYQDVPEDMRRMITNGQKDEFRVLFDTGMSVGRWGLNVRRYCQSRVQVCDMAM
ncbi:hypothetical protein BD311DRAFT_376382 [Dichomitus squalens]|uniref:Uncharacterized protein n=1 Tax=Dichomitus squalens TaxID=114155 RepID=A0A4Q9MJ61_9APHY|nr:hypothetical protein BD311DRAFT_376382 [Dichomitus squalens]